jgi:hypothetical protein
MNIMCVTCNTAIFYVYLLNVCRPRFIPAAILVDDVNIWFHRDLLP